MENSLKKYAIMASYFIMKEINDRLNEINSIILFGSVAQDRGGKDSDIDLFFDTEMSESRKRELSSVIRAAISQFHLSSDALKFKMEGISNEINFIVGNLSEWGDLQRNMSSSGIILYAKYELRPKKGMNHFIIISWETKAKGRGAFLNKMYGYKTSRKRYKGLVEKRGGMRIGKSAVMVLAKHKEEFFRHLEKYGINYNVIEVFKD